MIGVFDSGFGGLTVLQALQKKIPDYRYIYLGDQLHTPYGGRSMEAVFSLTEKGVNWLFEKGATLVLIACNTASADALRLLQEKYPDRKILGVLVPAVEEAIRVSQKKRIGVLSTQATHDSQAYLREMKKRGGEGFSVFSRAAPLLVPLVEEGWGKKMETKKILKSYLRSLKDMNIDTLILGCTHYSVLSSQIGIIMGKNCCIVSSSQAQAEATVGYVQRHAEIESQIEKGGGCSFFTTDVVLKFEQLSGQFFGASIQAEFVRI